MNTDGHPRSFRYSLRTLFVGFIAIGIFAWVATQLLQFQERLASEYNTAGVIRDVSVYVSTHGGQWPQSWADIPNGEQVRHSVLLRFDVNIAELVQDPELIHTVITPKSGEYRTYPDAGRQLEELRDILAERNGISRNRPTAQVLDLP